MPSSTSLLDADEGESEVPPPLHHPHSQVSHFRLLGTVLDLKPLSVHRPPSRDEVNKTAEDEDPEVVAADSLDGTGSSLLLQAHRHQHLPAGPNNSVMPPGMEPSHIETVLLYNGDERDDTGVGGSTLPSANSMAMLPAGVYGEPGFEAEPSLLSRRKSVNTTECVAVPSSEHVAEIVGRQGCKIKALRAKTNTYIKTPVRGEQPVFVVTGRKEDVAMAKREILSAAEHFSLIRASRNKTGPLSSVTALGTPTLPGQTTIQVRVPYRVVGLVVGPKDSYYKWTRVLREPRWRGWRRRLERTLPSTETGQSRPFQERVDNSDFQFNGTDVSFECSSLSSGGKDGWLRAGPSSPSGRSLLPVSMNGTQRVNSNISSGVRMSSTYRNDSSSSLGSGSSSADSFYSCGNGNRLADFSPTFSFNANANNNNNNNSNSSTSFWFGESLLGMGSEELVSLGGGGSSSGFDPLTISTAHTLHSAVQPHIWSPFVDNQSLQAFDTLQSQTSQPGTPRLSPTFSGSEALEHPQAQRVHQRPFGSAGTLDAQRLPSSSSAFSSSSESTTSSSSPPESSFCRPGLGSAGRGQEICIQCMDNHVIAALVPCGHNLFCLDCATQICQGPEAACPVCLSPATQAIELRNM
ncbi:hypothetical protein OJAV_G00088540 [Oryzias javanicus]|uniref:RING-type domain-containing protein n=1 Tax=Oryzias javanicus TaxID=123683 RepID=A0A3S2P9R5_ORYJA|nr:hypothetical protein OJAV_G00088540 [Oryzias javanicus]